MNAVDAKASFVDVKLDEETCTITDDGQGFRDVDAVRKNFAVFGLPQDEIEQLEKTYGHFRMGRGQMFNFGINEWRTNTFRMYVDLKKAAGEKDYKIPYQLTQGLPQAKGCSISIKLYEAMTLTSIADTQCDLMKWCRWAPIRVTFNDSRINMDPKQFKWDHATPEAYVKLKEGGSLALYNLGIFVCEFPSHKFGVGGEIVSLKQVKVNFARNDVQSDCPVWRKIRPFVVKQATRRNTEAKTLDEGARQRLAEQVKRGEISDYDCRSLKLVTAVTGRQFEIDDLNRIQGWKFYSNAKRGSRIGDHIMRCKVAFVIADETLERFGFKDVPEMLRWFRKNIFTKSYEKDACQKPFKPFSDLQRDFNDRRTLIPDHEWTPEEKLWMSVIDSAANRIKIDGKDIYGWNGRQLKLGDADRAEGWTDGESYVVIRRKFFADRPLLDIKNLTDAGFLLTHEACHGEDDFEDHDHDQAFYERFHDSIRYCMGDFLNAAMSSVVTHAGRLNKQLNKGQLKALDKVRVAGRASKNLGERVAAMTLLPEDET